MNAYDATAMAIFMFEGGNEHSPTSRNVRNNNPGNLRAYLSSQQVDSGGYRTFYSFADGWMALLGDIRAKVTVHLQAGATMLDFFNIYAPGADHNDPNGYAQFVVRWQSSALGHEVTLSTPVAAIFGTS
jgi:hypothetical protein